MRIVLAILLLAIGFWVWNNHRKPLSAEELRIVLIETRSQAVQSRAIAEARAASDITDVYYREQLRLLEQKTSEAVSELSGKPAEIKLREEVSALRKVGLILQLIEHALAISADQEALATNITRLLELISRLNSIEQRLLAG